MKFITTPLTFIGEQMLKLAGYLLIVMLLAQITIVALRYGFSIGAPWAQDLVTYCFCIAVMLPTLAVVTANTSVRVDIFYNGMPRRWQSRIDRIALLIMLAPAAGYGGYKSIGSTIISWQLLEASPTYGGMPGYFILKTTVTFCLLIVALTALAQSLSETPYPHAEQSS